MIETENPFKNYTPQKRLNMSYEIRKKIANMMECTTQKIMGQTKGWTERQLAGSLSDSLAYQEAPQKRWNNIRKEINSKLKQLNKNNK